MRWEHAFVVLLCASLPACGPTLDVTEPALREARAKWNRANVRDYNLEWVAQGPRLSGHYVVFVRGGRVEQVRSIQSGGREIIVKPGDPHFYSIDGLFQTLEEELDQARSEHPFGQPAGAHVLMRFDADPTLGFPARYRRDVSGSKMALSIDVVRLDTSPKLVGPIPPLPNLPGGAE